MTEGEIEGRVPRRARPAEPSGAVARADAEVRERAPASEAEGLVAIDTPDWVRSAIFYQIFPDRFCRSGRVPAPGPLEAWDAPPTAHGFKGGDLLGIVDHLDDLRELGITALYLTPIFASASNHRYHTYDYFSVDPLLGGDAALRELLDEAHRREMRVVLDGVFNHASRGFWPFQHVAENGAQSPYRGWFHLDEGVLRGQRSLQPYPDEEQRREIEALKARNEPSGVPSQRVLGYRAWWDLAALPKLNTGDPGMRAYLFAVAEHWLRFGIDGWRLDVPMEIADDEFWREFRRRVRAVNPEAYIVGEIWREQPRVLQGDMFDALMNYPLTEAVIGFTSGRHLDPAVAREQHEYSQFLRPLEAEAFGERLERTLQAYDPAVVAVQLNLLGSHDTPRFITVAGGDHTALRLATVIQMTLPGAPCIYYGDEVGVAGHHDPDNRRAYPWDRAAWDGGLRALIREAIDLRKGDPLLRDAGAYRRLAAVGMLYAYGRFGDDGDGMAGYVIAVNAGEAHGVVEASAPELAGRVLEVALNTAGAAERDSPAVRGASRGTVVDHDGRFRLSVPARTALVFRATALGRQAPQGRGR